MMPESDNRAVSQAESGPGTIAAAQAEQTARVATGAQAAAHTAASAESAATSQHHGADPVIARVASQDSSPEHPLSAAGREIEASDYADALRLARADVDNDLSLYVHLPFCPSRCLTCDHDTSVSHDNRQIDSYLDAIEREAELVTEHFGSGRRLQQLHLGGGTPNYLTELQLVRLLDIIERHFDIDGATETSLEANAHRASMAQLSLLHGLGFRSLNLELRDLDAHVQEALGRRQSLPVVRDVIETARSIGFERVSADLVYGLPRQTTDSIRETIDKLIGLEPDRIACYTYSRRPDSYQHQHAVDQAQMPSLADKVAIFSRIVDGLHGAGYDWVGLDCFARSDDPITRAHKAGSLHRNWIGYTDQPGRNLLGLGSSATTDLSTICVRNQSSIERWRGALESGQLPVERGTRLTAAQRQRRQVLSDLMCNLHVSQNPFLDDDEDNTLRCLEADGFVEISNEGVAITETGRYALHQLWGDASPSYRWAKLL